MPLDDKVVTRWLTRCHHRVLLHCIVQRPLTNYFVRHSRAFMQIACKHNGGALDHRLRSTRTPTMTLDIGNYDAVTFDCYGTLIDWDTGVSNFLGPWAINSGFKHPISMLVEKFAERQFRNQRARPFKNYPAVLQDALRQAITSLGATASDDFLDQFAASVGTWPAFADTVDALRVLKSNGLHLGIVSNVDNASFVGSHERLGGVIDTVVTAEMTKAYKPDLNMFEALFSALEDKGIRRDRILHVAQSQFHDVAPGNKVGLDVVWINRRHGKPGKGVTIFDDAEPMMQFHNLEEMCAGANLQLLGKKRTKLFL